jgi:hypothetical protein
MRIHIYLNIFEKQLQIVLIAFRDDIHHVGHPRASTAHNSHTYALRGF